jgi:hypothetical protein
MATVTLDEVLELAQQLSPEDQVRLIEHMAPTLATKIQSKDLISAAHERTPQRRRITELRGLGKELWQGIDSTEYLRQERDAWDG